MTRITPAIPCEEAINNFQKGLGKGPPTDVVFVNGKLKLVFEDEGMTHNHDPGP
jgi:hypothetical protein